MQLLPLAILSSELVPRVNPGVQNPVSESEMFFGPITGSGPGNSIGQQIMPVSAAEHMQ